MEAIFIGILAGGAFVALLLMVVRGRKTGLTAQHSSASRIRAQARADGLRMKVAGGRFEIEGTFFRVQLHVESQLRDQPITRGGGRNVGRISLTVPISNLLIRDETESPFDQEPVGLVKAAPPSGLDARYTVFLPPEIASVAATGPFRVQRRAEPLGWLTPAIIEQFRQLKVVSLRVQDHACEILTAPLSEELAYVALGLGANIARATSGRSMVPEVALMPTASGGWVHRLLPSGRRRASGRETRALRKQEKR